MMKGIWIVLLCAFSGGAMAEQDYEPCDKTYVNPFEVSLEGNSIKVKDGEGLSQTSAIFADQNGLYYKDLLFESEEELGIPDPTLDELLLVESDELVDPFEMFEEDLGLDYPEEEVITEEELALEEVQILPSSPKPPATSSWPFCDKMR